MKQDGTMKIKRSDKAVCRIIDGEVVILIPEESVLYALGGCGSRIWELIEKEISVSDLVDVICDEYEVELERAKEDIDEFINNLRKLNLVEVVTGINEEVGR